MNLYFNEEHKNKFSTAGIILSGGGFFSRSVEVFTLQNGTSCFLPSLPDDRAYHTMESLLICGGSGELAKDTCLSLQEGRWVTSHDMVERRAGHSSWETEEGVLLIGGGTETGSIHNTSEILPWSGNHGVPAFTMQDPSTLVPTTLCLYYGILQGVLCDHRPV